MKHIHQHLIFLLTLFILLTLLGFVLAGAADAELPFIVRTIYFQPTNAPAPTDRIAELMLEVQDFYHAEMERNGYGAKTFRLETDTDGNVVVHTVKGRNNIAHYSATTAASIRQELPAELKNSNNIYVIIVAGLRLVRQPGMGRRLGPSMVQTLAAMRLSQQRADISGSPSSRTNSVMHSAYTTMLRAGNFLMGPGSKALDTYEAR